MHVQARMHVPTRARTYQNAYIGACVHAYVCPCLHVAALAFAFAPAMKYTPKKQIQVDSATVANLSIVFKVCVSLTLMS